MPSKEFTLPTLTANERSILVSCLLIQKRRLEEYLETASLADNKMIFDELRDVTALYQKIQSHF